MRNLAVIDLNRLKKNALLIKSRLNGGVKFCAVVKADGYGHGASEVANAIYDIADCFAVALVEEGVSLRQSGVDKDILVLIPAFNSDLERAVRYNLTLTVGRKADLVQLAKECERQGKVVKAHVKVDTGMHRQGISGVGELIEVFNYAKRKGITIEGVYSHFACPEQEKSRNRAYNKFLLALSVAKSYNNKIISHISASGGFIKGVYCDMVRIGILLYGYKPFKSDIAVKPIMKLYAPALKTRTLKVGDSALYGDKRAKKKQDVTLIRYGYADGLDRVKTHGQFNNRCMDITAVKGRYRRYPVLVDADELAKKYRTVSYEILTKACIRAERFYKR